MHYEDRIMYKNRVFVKSFSLKLRWEYVPWVKIITFNFTKSYLLLERLFFQLMLKFGKTMLRINNCYGKINNVVNSLSSKQQWFLKNNTKDTVVINVTRAALRQGTYSQSFQE